MFETAPILESDVVKLRVLAENDIEALSDIADDDTIWSYFTSDLYSNDDMKEWVTQAVLEYKQQTRVPFLIYDKRIGKIAGSTSYGSIALNHSRLEIGWTWLGKEFQGTGLNRHCKMLLLEYAFEQLELQRVEFKTDVLNKQSRKALLNIGATEEGVLRSHTPMPGHRRRDTIYYSILADEWPAVKAKNKEVLR